MKAIRCRYCPQLLLTPESKARGYGLICGRKRGLIPPATPRHRGTTPPVKPVTTPAVHPGQTAIPIQPQLPEEDAVPMTHEQHDRELQMREGLETGFTDQTWAIGYVICPAREKCPSGLRALFKPLKNGRLPMHRHGTYGDPCPGARQKPTTPPLQLRDTTKEN